MEQKPFAAFLDLVTFDQSLRVLKLEIESLCQQIKLFLEQRLNLMTDIQESTVRVNELIEQVKGKELLMATMDQEEKEKRRKIGQLFEYRDIKALQSEIDALGQAQIKSEQELMQLWNKIEHAQKDLTRVKKQYEQQFSDVDQKIQEYQNRREQKEQELVRMYDERLLKEAIVPQEWLESYNTMATRVHDPVVKVEYDACGACSTAIAKQDLLRLERRAVLPCRLCFRLLYLERVMQLESLVL